MKTAFIIGNGPTDPKEKAAWLLELKQQGKKPLSVVEKVSVLGMNLGYRIQHYR